MEDQGGIPCVIYAAKSTEDRHGSIPGQLEECRNAIHQDPGRTVIAEYCDEAYSGYKRDRGPALADAIGHVERLAAQHAAAELWVQHSDRLARGDGKTALHTVELALWAIKHDIRIRTLQDPAHEELFWRLWALVLDDGAVCSPAANGLLDRVLGGLVGSDGDDSA